MALDIFAPEISQVSKDMKGKTMLLYGTNRTGKTCQACRFDKPVYLAFERGINGINNIPFFPMQKFSDCIAFIKQITNPKNIDKVKEKYQTVIIDTADIFGNQCRRYICEKFGVERIGDGNNGYGLWKEYEDEIDKWLNLLTSVGLSVIFIAHETTREFTDENGDKYEKIYPKGDKRIIDPICDLVDIIGYTSVNNAEDGKTMLSTLYLDQSKKFHAGSRFDYLPYCINPFTAANLQTAIKEAIQQQEEAEGFEAVDYDTQQISYVSKNEMSFEELRDKIGEIALKMNEEGQMDKYFEIVAEYLGKDKKVSETTKMQSQQLSLILSELEELSL